MTIWRTRLASANSLASFFKCSSIVVARGVSAGAAYAMGGVVYIAPELGIAGAGDLKRVLDKPLYYGSQGATSLDLVALHPSLNEAGCSLKLPVLEARSNSVSDDQAAC